MISLIAAMDQERGIGAENKLLWHLPDDFKWFKQHTLQKPVIMGKNTMLSLGKPLVNRLNIVLTHKPEQLLSGFIHATDIEHAITLASKEEKEIMVIGGANIYKQFLPLANRMYLTHIFHKVEGMDAYFPEWDAQQWQLSFKQYHAADAKHIYPFEFRIWDRV